MSLRNRASRTFAVLVVLAVAGVASLSSQDTKAGLSGGLGTEVIEGQTYQTLSILPDLAIGPVGIGVDLSFHFQLNNAAGDFGFYPRGEDLYDSRYDFLYNLNKWTSRIAYFRYGTPGAPLYVQAGVLPSVTLGNGFIVGGYANNLLQPLQKFAGLALGIDGSLFQFPYVGATVFTSNISGFELNALRVYAKPGALFLPDVAPLKDLQVGLTVAVDPNPRAFEKVTTGASAVSINGLDASLPLVNLPIFTARAYWDLANQGAHVGTVLGVGGSAFGVLNWGLSQRLLGDDFLPGYFNKAYDVQRVAKYAIYSDTGTGANALVPANFGWGLSAGANFGNMVVFDASLGGPYAAGVVGKAYTFPSLESSLSIKNIDVLPLSVDAFYNKSNLTDLSQVFSPKDAVVGARIGYAIGATTITMVYSLTYQPDGTWVTTSRLETAVKFF